MKAAILIPIKDHAHAKSRMAPLLTAEERACLAWAMLEDLIAALSPLPGPVVVVTNSDRVSARVKSLAWKVFREHAQLSENASVDDASQRLVREGVQAVVRLPADLPLIRTEDIEDLLSIPVRPPGAILVPSWDGTGTNALLRTPPDLFPSRFGPNSFTLHTQAAAAAGAELRIVKNARLELDLDEPTDLARFMTFRVDTHTYRTLTGFNIIERLADYAAQRSADLGIERNT